jgi:hypothetical protein
MAAVLHDTWVTHKARVLYRGATPPDTTGFYLCLANTNTLTRSSNKADFFQHELLEGNGYSRKVLTYSADGSYDVTDQRHEMPTVSLSWTASGAALQYQTAFLIADAKAGAPASVSFDGSAAINVANDTIEIAAHNLNNQDDVLFKPRAGASMFGGASANTLYKVLNATSSTFKISTDGINPINLSSIGSGTIDLSYANGRIVTLNLEVDPVTIADGQTLEYDFDLVEMNTNYGAGV